jgi:hypothetical protein
VLPDDASFSVDASTLDRRRLLADAARELDVLSGHFGPGGEPSPSPEGELARLLSQEIAELGEFPDAREITAADFAVTGEAPPAAFSLGARDNLYVWMRIPLALRPKVDWAFSRLELGIEFNPGDGDPRLRPKAHAILPHRRFQTFFEGRARAELSFDSRFELSAGIPRVDLPAPVPVGAEAQAAARVGGGLGVRTNYEWRLKRARIDHTETGLARVFWRIDGAEFFAEDVPTPIVVIRVPRPAGELRVAAALQVYRHISLLNASMQQRILGLPRRLKDFFTGGSPLRDEVAWDLGSLLEAARG